MHAAAPPLVFALTLLVFGACRTLAPPLADPAPCPAVDATPAAPQAPPPAPQVPPPSLRWLYVPGMSHDGVPHIDQMPFVLGPSDALRRRLEAGVPSRAVRIAALEAALAEHGRLAPDDLFALAEARREAALYAFAGLMSGWKPPRCPPRKRCYPATHFMPMPGPDYRVAVADLRALLHTHPDWSGAPRARYHLASLLSRRGAAQDRSAAVAAFSALVRAHPASEWSIPARVALASALMAEKNPAAARPHLEVVCRSRHRVASGSCRALAGLLTAAGERTDAIALLLAIRERSAAELESEPLVDRIDKDLVATWSQVDGGWKAARAHLRLMGVPQDKAQRLQREMAEHLVSHGRKVDAIALLDALRTEVRARRDLKQIDKQLRRLRD